jgi:basic membrane protein A and related proteins
VPTAQSFLSRRQVMRGILATAAFSVTSRLVGCRSSSSDGAKTEPAGSAQQQLEMGFIYVGPKDDYGYNQAHAQGKTGVAQLPGVKTVEQALVPETTEVQEVMRNMIEQDGVKAIFPTSFGYFDPHVLKIAQDFPEVQFFHCGGLYQEGKHPKNVGSYFGYIDEAQYIAGVVAALTSKTGKLGFIAAKPIPQVLRNINSFTLGARSVRADATTKVVFTGDWSLPVKEAEAANSLVDQGIDVLTCHVDSPKVVITTAEKRGVFCSGYHVNQQALAPKGYLTGAEWNWTQIYETYASEIQAGKTLMNGGIPHLVRGGLKEGFLTVSAYGAAVKAETKAKAEAVKSKLMAGSMVIYKGPIKDNEGKVVIPDKTEHRQQDPALEAMNWLVEGVMGQA